MTRNKEDGTQVTIPFTENRGDCEVRCWEYSRPTSGSTILIKGNVTHFMNICRQTGVATIIDGIRVAWCQIHTRRTHSTQVALKIRYSWRPAWFYFSTKLVITRNFTPPPSVQSPGILTFEDWIVQIPVPSGQDNVQRLCPICRIWRPNTPPKEQNMALYVMMPSAKTKTKNYEIWLEME